MKGWIIALSAIILLLIVYLVFRPKKTVLHKEVTVKEKIDSIYTTNDSIITTIDTVYKELEKVVVEHEKTVDIIVHNDGGEDYKFFRNYIESNKARLDSMYNLSGS